MRPPVLRLHTEELIVDNFAGGGGASLGIEWALGRSPDIAINHDPQAVAMHAANHPNTRHYVEDVWKVDPVKACAGRPVGLAWFSPDCKHFSKAKGGKPVSKKIRGLAWIVVKWAKLVKPRVICLENVEEFQDWGPLGEDDRPCKLRKGLTFQRWKAQLENLGYKVEWREVVAADYGAPTTRKRLFLVARCDGKPIVWPEPTHGKHRIPYRTAAECIDWTLPCHSIFMPPEEAKALGIKRPLAENTMRRIARGLKKFVLDNPRPFIVPYYGLKGNETRAHDVNEPLRTQTADPTFSLIVPHVAVHTTGHPGAAADQPLPTITTGGQHALVAPLVAKFRGDSPGSAIDAPLPTITAGPKERPAGAAHAMAIVSAGIVPLTHQGGGDQVRSVEQPLSTVTSKAEHLLVAPTLVQTGYGERPGQAPRAPGLDKPLGTVVSGGGKHALVAAFLAKHYGDTGQRPGSGMEEPVATITASDHHALVASSIVKLKGTCQDGQQLDLPLHTVQAGGQHYAESRAFLSRYNGCSVGQVPQLPLSTIDATDRLGVVMVHGEPYVITDIGMRMLVPRELYTAQGFPASYRIDIEFNGKPLPKDAQVRMCGNSVSPYPCAAIVRAQFQDAEEAVAA